MIARRAAPFPASAWRLASATSRMTWVALSTNLIDKLSATETFSFTQLIFQATSRRSRRRWMALSDTDATVTQPPSWECKSTSYPVSLAVARADGIAGARLMVPQGPDGR